MSDASPAALDLGALKPLLLEEWPQLDAGAIDATGGDRAALIALIAEKTEHTRALVGRQLDELVSLTGGKSRTDAVISKLEASLRRLEGRANEVVDRVKGDLVPTATARVEEAQAKVQENIWVSLAAALGIGLLLGLLFGSSVARGR